MNEKEIKELNLFEKLNLITNEIGVIEKNLKIDVTKTRSYKAVSERDVLDGIKPLENKYRVYSYPVSRIITQTDTLTKENEYGTTTSIFMRIETTYRFVNIDKPEEYIETIVYGDGIDTGDKAPGKAMTYADKYALMKAYKLSTGDDPDKEASPTKGYVKQNDLDDINKHEELEIKLGNLITKNKIDYSKLCEKYKLAEEDIHHMSIKQLENAIENIDKFEKVA